MLVTLYSMPYRSYTLGSPIGSFELVGQGITLPTGYFDVSVIATNNTAYGFAPTDVTHLVYQSTPRTSHNRIWKVNSVETLTAGVWRFYCTIDAVMDYFNLGGSIRKLYGARVRKSSDSLTWNKWEYVELPSNGRKVCARVTGNTIPRDYTDASLNKQAYLVTLKVPAYGENYKTAYLVDKDDLKDLYNNMQQKDNPSGNIFIQKSLGCIEGIYFLPGVYINDTHTVSNLIGASLVATHPVIDNPEFTNPGQLLNISTGTAAQASDPDWGKITQSNDTRCAYLAVDTGLSYNFTDFRDIYYRSYRAYLPYIGTVDIPVSNMISYNNTMETVEFDINYIFDLRGGRITYEWQSLPGQRPAGWTNLPQMPLIGSTIGVSAYQNDAKTDMAMVNAALGGLIPFATSAATGNIVGAATAAGSVILSNISAQGQHNIADNVLKANALNVSTSTGWESWSDSQFQLVTITVDHLTSTAFTNYMELHGYPCNYPCETYGYLGGVKLWIDTTDLNLDYSIATIPRADWYINAIKTTLSVGWIWSKNYT